MSGTRTEWHLADMSEEADPFGDVVYTTGLQIDLTAPEEELAEQFKRLLRTEDRIARTGLTCDLKDSGQDCLTCPVASLNAEDVLSRLCRLGKDQSTVEKACAAAQAENRGEMVELGDFHEQMVEFGELSDELDDLLTSVGL